VKRPDGVFHDLIAANLQAAYAAAAGNDQPQAEASGGTPLTPEMKTAIAAEVQQQLAAEH
jgi:hypothetical protein